MIKYRVFGTDNTFRTVRQCLNFEVANQFGEPTGMVSGCVKQWIVDGKEKTEWVNYDQSEVRAAILAHARGFGEVPA